MSFGPLIDAVCNFDYKLGNIASSPGINMILIFDYTSTTLNVTGIHGNNDKCPSTRNRRHVAVELPGVPAFCTVSFNKFGVV